jgi:hypothetical protein
LCEKHTDNNDKFSLKSFFFSKVKISLHLPLMQKYVFCSILYKLERISKSKFSKEEVFMILVESSSTGQQIKIKDWIGFYVKVKELKMFPRLPSHSH